MMKTKREKPKKSLSRRLVLAVDGVINHLLLIFAALIFLFGFYALWDSNQVYSLASSSEYEAYRPVTTQQDELASFSGFSKLQELNPEVLGWINVYGTNIDYPLVQAKDNEKYLNKDSKGEFAATGAIFLDARNNPKFEDFNTIIYGHHVENGVMFGDVAKFADKEFFDQHRYGSIYYNGRERGLEIFGILEVDAYDTEIYRTLSSKDEEHQAYYQYLLSKAKYKRDVSLTSTDKIVLLSTCFLNITNGRHILLAKITDAPVKVAQDESGEAVGTRYFDHGIPTSCPYHPNYKTR